MAKQEQEYERSIRRREAEEQLVGYMLRDARQGCEFLDSAIDELRREDFVDPQAGAAFEAICTVRKEGGLVFENSVAQASKGAVSASYLTDLVERAGGLATTRIPVLVEALRRESRQDAREIELRRALELNKNDDGEGVLSLLKKLPELCDDAKEERDDATRHDRDLAEEARAMEAGTFVDAARIPMGIKYVDYLLKGGISAGEMLILAARPACGKTALAVHVAAEVLKAGKTVLFATLEMSRKEIFRRIVSNLAEVRFPQSQEEWDRVWNSADDEGKARLKSLCAERQEIASRLLFVGNMPRSRFFAKIRSMFRREAFDLLIIDYIQLLEGEAGELNSYERTTLNSQQMKSLANDLGIPVLALAQLNRATENENRPPRMSDLRGSGSIEQDADFILLLSDATGQTEEEKNNEPPRKKTRRLDFVKNRRGATGTKNLSFNFLTFKVKEAGFS